MRAGLLVGGLIFLIVGLLFSLTIIGLIIGIPLDLIGFIMILVGLFSGGKPQNITIQQTVDRDTKGSISNEAMSTLKMRYAKGEISKKEYNYMKKELE